MASSIYDFRSQLDPLAQEFQEELWLAANLAHQAGQGVLKHYQDGVKVEFKKPDDPVTQADRDANDFIVEAVQNAYPDDGILAEESPDTTRRFEKRRLWCIDPVDGTADFVDRTGMFVVMIGLAIDGESKVGAVYQPTTQALYIGAGQTALQVFTDHVEKISVKDVPSTAEATMVVSRSHRGPQISEVIETLGNPSEIPTGSVGLKACRIAMGDAQIYASLTDRTMEWDACGPEAIVRAAGGRVSDVFGDPLRYNKKKANTPRGIVCTNGVLHPEVIAATSAVAEAAGRKRDEL